jgi:hypothetical protein
MKLISAVLNSLAGRSFAEIDQARQASLSPTERAAEEADDVLFLDRVKKEQETTRQGFLARGQIIPDFLLPKSIREKRDKQRQLDSILAEGARLKASLKTAEDETAQVKAASARIAAETRAIEAETAALRASPAGQESIKRLAECRASLGRLLQIDAELVRHDRNAGLLLSYCTGMGIGLPLNLPPKPEVAASVVALRNVDHLRRECARYDIKLPAGLTTHAEVSAFVISTYAPRPIVPASPPANATSVPAASSKKPEPRRSRIISPSKPAASDDEHRDNRLGF